MEDVDEYLSSRRNFIKAGATAAVAGLAGCSGDDNGNGGRTSEPTEAGTPTDEPSNEGGSDPTATEGEATGTETSGSEGDNGSSSLLEEDEPESEEQWEDEMLESGLYPNDAWIEMENPSEQIPEENYSFDEFPNLQIFEEIDLYSDENEAVYLTWIDTGERVELGAATVMTYDNPDTDETASTSGSKKYTEQSADVGRILEEVIEGVDDVSDNIGDEYAEILRTS